MKRLWFALCAAMLFTHVASAHHNAVQSADRSSAGWPVGDFALSDDRGQPFTQDRLRGRWTFVLLGDTQCANACSVPLEALAGLCRRIAGTEALKTTQVVFVLLDPQRDSPNWLRQYVTSFDPRFVGVTGPRTTLEGLADDLGLHDQAQAQALRGALVLVGPDGAVRAQYLPPFEVPLLTADYLKTRARK
jgi:protein SCO1/2